jgi:hypothetical protein
LHGWTPTEEIQKTMSDSIQPARRWLGYLQLD